VEEPDEFGMFLDIMRSVTGQKNAKGEDIYNALVYDNVRKTQKLNEVFKIYRNEGEKYIEDIKLGDKEWREYNGKHYKDEDYETQLRDHRKQQRLLRLHQYREYQSWRKNNPAASVQEYRKLHPGELNRPGVTGELDFYDDTDSEEEQEAASTHDSVRLQNRGGSSMLLKFNKQQSDVKWALPQTSGRPQPVVEALPSPPPATFQSPYQSSLYQQAQSSLYQQSQTSPYQQAQSSLYQQPQHVRNPYSDQPLQFGYRQALSPPNTSSWVDQQNFIRSNSMYAAPKVL
jgi:hypothetical protein